MQSTTVCLMRSGLMVCNVLSLQVYDITDKHTLQQVQNWVKELQAMVSSSYGISLRHTGLSACWRVSTAIHHITKSVEPLGMT